MKDKEWWKSKTVWFGLAWALLGVVQVVLNFFGYAEWQPSSDLAAVLALVNAVIIIILRKVTTTAIRG